MLSRNTIPSPLIRVQTWERQGAVVPESVTSLLRLEWPMQAGAVAAGRVQVICINPTDWLLIADPTVPADELLEALREALRGSAFRVTGMSAALARVEIAGEHAPKLLSKVCALEPVVGRAPRTMMGGIPAVLWCRDSSTFECIIASSYADYFMSWLGDAALEFNGAQN